MSSWAGAGLWILIGVIGAAILTKVLLPSVGRWGYEKLITERKVREKDRKRKQQIRLLLRESFAWNLELLEKMDHMMSNKNEKERQVPTFNIDIPILESTAGLIQLEVLDDVEAYKVIDRARFELSHVERKVNWVSNMYMNRPRSLPSPESKSLDARDEVFFQLVRSTLLLIRSCEGDCRRAIAELDRLETSASPSKPKWYSTK